MASVCSEFSAGGARPPGKWRWGVRVAPRLLSDPWPLGDFLRFLWGCGALAEVTEAGHGRPLARTPSSSGHGRSLSPPARAREAPAPTPGPVLSAECAPCQPRVRGAWVPFHRGPPGRQAWGGDGARATPGPHRPWGFWGRGGCVRLSGGGGQEGAAPGNAKPSLCRYLGQQFCLIGTPPPAPHSSPPCHTPDHRPS